MNYRILIAEDEDNLRNVLCDFFESRGDTPIPAANGTAALALAREQEFDGVLLDIMMPGQHPHRRHSERGADPAAAVL